MRLIVLAAFAILSSPLAAQAQTAPAAPVACAELDQRLPPELLGWPHKATLTAAVGVKDLDKAVLAPGRAYVATLAPTSKVTYVVTPGRMGDPAGAGGLFAVDIPKAGSYVVALGAGAWIDVLRDGVVQRSVGHGHGPACTTLRKMVTFGLQSGHHIVQIAGAGGDSLPIMIVAKP